MAFGCSSSSLSFSFFADVLAREHGSNKQVASKSCALSLVRQLYHMSVIESYTGQKKKKDADKVRWLSSSLAEMIGIKAADNWSTANYRKRSVGF